MLQPTARLAAIDNKNDDADNEDNECHANYGDSESYDFDISVKDRKIS